MAIERKRPLKVGVQLPEVEREVRWAELRDMARTAEEVGFDSLWVGDHLLYRKPLGPVAPLGGVDHHGIAGRDDDAGRDRPAGGVHRVPQPAGAGQDGRHARRDQWRPVHPGPWRRLE